MTPTPTPLTELMLDSAPAFERKIVTMSQLQASALPAQWVLTNGVFDVLHRGHVTYLARARSLGDALVVAVNSDASARRLGKGPERPLNTCTDRMALLAALTCVDYVLSFDEDTAVGVLTQLQPPIWVKGGDYTIAQTPEGQVLDQYGGRGAVIPFEFNRSTTQLVKKIQQAAS